MKSDFKIDNMEEDFYSKLKPKYSKSKKEIWSEFDSILSKNKEKKKTKIIQNLWFKYGIAASFLILFSTGLFMRFYTINISSLSGEIVNQKLPDGSIIQLNSESNISYHPYWWKINRSVNLDGEAFFKVKRGEKFNVRSLNGTTQVLGTSFNIYSRNKAYKVYCKSGKVLVIDNQSNQLILKPGEFASISKELNKIELNNELNSDHILSWKSEMFRYKATPLAKVFEDFEIKYGIKIKCEYDEINKLNYTGFFERNIGLKKALDLVCYSFNLKIEKVKNNLYLVNK